VILLLLLLLLMMMMWLLVMSKFVCFIDKLFAVISEKLGKGETIIIAV
jgi:hypothetical protein